MTATIPSARAGDSKAGIDVTFDRDAQDFAIPSATKVKLSLSHRFDNGIAVGGSVEVTDSAFRRSEKTNLEGTVGYRLGLTERWSVSATLGLGERFRTAEDGGDFPFYRATIAADAKLTDRLSWNVLSLRYRNAFDPANDYDTPQAATALTYEFAPSQWISLKLSRTRKGDIPSSTGIAIGYQVGF